MTLAFSAIISVGELVLPEVIVGITEASTTRSPRSPCTRRRASTTLPRIVRGAHPAGAHRMEDRRADVAGGARELLVADDAAGRAASPPA